MDILTTKLQELAQYLDLIQILTEALVMKVINYREQDNTTETGTNNTYIIGENNTVKGLSRNNIIVGNQ